MNKFKAIPLTFIEKDGSESDGVEIVYGAEEIYTHGVCIFEIKDSMCPFTHDQNLKHAKEIVRILNEHWAIELPDVTSIKEIKNVNNEKVQT